MTIDDFDTRNWVAGMTCFYERKHRKIACVDFQERLIGLQNLNHAVDVNWVRCENVVCVTYPEVK